MLQRLRYSEAVVLCVLWLTPFPWSFFCHPRASKWCTKVAQLGATAGPQGRCYNRQGSVAIGLAPAMRAPLLGDFRCHSVVMQSSGLPEIYIRRAALCGVYITLSASGPVLLDWVKCYHGGRFPFSIPALTFHAYAISALLGLVWTSSRGREGWKQLMRFDMLWRVSVTTSLFTIGDILSFMSIQHLDVGTFSLVGKAFAIVITVLLSRLVLGTRQSGLQYLLVSTVAATTIAFCHAEMHARGLMISMASSDYALRPRWASHWIAGLTQRTVAVGLTSLAAVLQEKLLAREPGIPFLLQQCWMGCGAMATSFFTLRFVHRLPSSHLLQGFGDWRVIVLLVMYVANGLTAGLMVKRLGAVAKVLCVPIYLGFCYAYAVRTGSAALTAPAVAAWVASTVCILLYAVTKAAGRRAARLCQVLPKYRHSGDSKN